MSLESDPELARIERHYRRIYRHLDPSDLTRHDDWPRHTDGVTRAGEDEDNRFLDYYSAEGLQLALEHYGLMDELRRKNLGEPVLSLHQHEKGYDIARIHCAAVQTPLIELVVEISPLPGHCREFFDSAGENYLYVRWLRMQNPRAMARPDRPLLPGQDHPGLGLGREMLVLLQLICSRLELAGVVELPERLHNAALYFRRFRFLDPAMQGQLTAILRDARKRKLVDLAWGVELGGLIDRSTGKPFRWTPSEQVLPRTKAVLDYLNSDDYLEKARQAMERCQFHLSSGDLAEDLAIEKGSDSLRIK